MSLSYELEKQLKGAGFPHKTKTIPFSSARFITNKQLREDAEFFDELGNVPTLSELIAACGEYFAGLRRMQSDEWCAFGARANPYFAGDEKGHTPEEAVAKLWLALHGNTTPV